MTGLMDLLTGLRQRGVELHLEGDKLRLRAPKGALTDELREALAGRRDEVVDFLRRARGSGESSHSRPIRRVPRDRDLPLSFAQERLWILDRLQPGSAAYNMFDALWVRGELSPALLAAVLGEIVRRHETLRTTFAEREGGPVQVIAPPCRPPLPLVDLSALPEAARQAAALELIREESLRPFDLARGPLLRVRLLRLAAAEHALLLNAHHVVSDGWSQGVLVREITALYGAAHAGAPSPLPELAVQYADFSLWQREGLAGEELERHLEYWRLRLAGLPAAIELPFDRPRPALPSYRGAEVTTVLDAGMTGELTRLARGHEATLFMVLLAAFQLLLFRLTGEEDLPVGSPVANRGRPEVEPLIGFFANTLVLRGDLTDDPSFRELLARVRRTTLEAYDHQDLPFERLVEALRPERRLETNPLFQVLCALQNAPAGAIELTGLSLSPVEAGATATRFDLELLAWDQGGALRTVLGYSPDTFDPATLHRFSGYLEILLRSLPADPDRPISAVSLLSAGERQQLVREWNDTEGKIAAVALAHQIVARQAALTPDAAAVEHAGERLTYRELAARAGHLAAVLRGAGVGPDEPVGLWVGRSPALPVSVLAVLAAGGACLPLDPSYPTERLALMIGDAGPRLILAEEGQLAGMPPELREGLATVVLNERGEAIGTAAPAPPSSPDLGLHPDHLAYVLYTSGSTGRPKGVALTHRALVNMAAWACSVRPDRRRVLQFSPLSFDVAFEEMFSTWGSGGTLVLMPEELRRDPNALLAFLIAARIERFFQPFVSLQQVAEAASEQGRRPPALRELITAGEQLRVTPAVAALCRGGVRLFNEYGPTETHVTSAFLLTGDPAGWPALPPIGRPIANHRIHLLDRGRQPVPVGVAGELSIGGIGLARGYFRRPDLTADRFAPDPSGIEPGARLYRTGDLARYTAGGDLQYLGRLDAQVKVRGYRVEPGEVEAAMAAYPGVLDAAVVARQDPPGGLRLVAYVVWEGEGSAGDGLREALRATLPAPMVPSDFVELAALPLTPSGKVDRRALAGPAFTPQRRASSDYVEPAAGTETELAAIWSDLLSAGRVGAEDDFFDLGGHSLLAARLVSRLRQAFGVEPPLRAIFEAPTVAGLAAWIERARRTARGSSLVPPVVRVPRDRPLPLSFAQERLWFVYLLNPASPAYNMISGMRLAGPLDVAALAAALSEVLRRHEPLRTVFRTPAAGGAVPSLTGAVQEILAWAPLPQSLVDLAALPVAAREAEVGRICAGEAARPFDLQRGPLLSALLLRLAAKEHVALWRTHHIAVDGWSLSAVFIPELATLYAAAVERRPSPLPELAVQYADYAVWQRDWLAGAELDRQLAFWRQELAGAPAALDLPGDRPRPPIESFRGAAVPLALGRELSGALTHLGRTRDATPFMVLTAALALLLSRWTGADDVVLGSPIANRRRPELEGLLGMFVNTLALRVRLAGAATFEELLARVRGATFGAFEHQDLPFEKLVEGLEVRRDLSRHPLFQAVFTFQNAGRGRLELPGLELSPVDFSTGTTKFDLTFNLTESAGEIAGTLEYATDLFDAATVERLVGHLRNLLAGIAAAPSTPSMPLEDLPLLGDEERRQLLAWSGVPPVHPRAASIPGLFAEQVARTPDAVAVICGDSMLTYAELARRARGVAARLLALRLPPESRVAVLAERSPALIAGLLGILQAGCAYLPLDPELPAERLRFLLADAGAAVLLGDLPLDGVTALALERGEAEDVAPILPVITASQLAYVMYTSGSTGTPKGVAVTHGNVVRLVRGADWADLGPGETFLQLANPAFDAATLEIWAPLLNGGRSALFPGRRGSLDDVAEAIARHGVTTLWLTAGLFAQMVQDRLEGLRPLRQLLAGGDVLSPAHVRRALTGLPGCTVINGYGPTENTTFTACFPMTAADLAAAPLAASVPIGRPIRGTRVHVLDATLRPVPVGVWGELFAGGDGVARGYLGSPAQTAERFVPDPWGFEPGARLYRTGDVVRWRPAGVLEFLGRRDGQVKIRGFRVEMGEIEAALARHPRVTAAVVIPWEVAGDRRLAAYVVVDPTAAPDAAELRRHLGASLPEAMIPAAFVLLDRLPLTPNGKVDRRALPDPDPMVASVVEYLAPASPLEESLAAACAEVLGLDRVGMRDNFFALGGHSLLAVQLISRLRDRYAIEVPLQKIFEAADLLDLADGLVGQVMAEVGDLSLEELQALLSAEESAP